MCFVQARLVRVREQGSRESEGEREEQVLSEEVRSELRRRKRGGWGGRGGERRRGWGEGRGRKDEKDSAAAR